MNIKSIQLIIDKLILILLSLCIGVMPLIYLPYNKFSLVPYRLDVIFQPKQNFLIAMEIILLILFAIHIKINKKPFIFNRAFIFLGIFYILLAISTIFSKFSKIAVFGRPFRLEGFLAYTSYILLLMMIYYFIDNKEKIKTILYSLLLSAILISIYGILQYYNIDPIYKDPYIITGIYKNRAFSTLGNPVFAGSYSSMLFTLAFILFTLSKGRKIYFFGFLTILYFIFLLSTSSKAGIIGAFFSLLIFLILLRKRIGSLKKRLLILLFVLIVSTVFIEITGKPVSPLNRFTQFFNEINFKPPSKILTKRDPINRGSVVFKKNFTRIYIYKTSIGLLFKSPLLGSGLDTFNEVFPQERNMRLLDKAHNEYLQLGISSGIPALIFYLLFLVSFIKKNLKLHKAYQLYQLAFFFAILAYWIQAFFNISVVSVAPIYWGLMGLNLAVLNVSELKD